MGPHLKVGRRLDQTHRSGHHQPQKHRSRDQKHVRNTRHPDRPLDYQNIGSYRYDHEWPKGAVTL